MSTSIARSIHVLEKKNGKNQKECRPNYYCLYVYDREKWWLKSKEEGGLNHYFYRVEFKISLVILLWYKKSFAQFSLKSMGCTSELIYFWKYRNFWKHISTWCIYIS